MTVTAMQEIEVIKQAGYEVRVERTSRRKSATIKVEEGVVAVVVPKALSSEKVHQLVAAKHQWILEKLAIHAEARPLRGKEYVSGEAFPYLGRNYRLKVVSGKVSPTKLVDGKITVTVPEYAKQAHFVRRALVHWYKRNADKKIREKVDRYQSVVGVETAVVRIKDFKSRWGSCTPYGDLEFNWLIVLAPNRIVDYVVVHELCHLLHHDHSPQFWKEVERVMPDYRECKEWLRDHAQLLVV
ncbi:SprT family zinc-dependent metalloprotease [Shewanella xiamenensis]|uniref:M48 family metallopeptidase n=1 Tax=Shewanella xiamenensis TaxID=332186 RepID=UPI00313D293D